MCKLENILPRATGITCDSRKVKAGFIFVAVQGHKFDGNMFIDDAISRGAIAIVTDSKKINLGVPTFLVKNARQALSRLAAEFYNHPSRELQLVGITGTNGKTTIAHMTEHIFRSHGFNTGLIGTLEVNLGKTSHASTLTTPDAAELQYYFRNMRQNGVTHAAMEVSAQGIDMNRTDDVSFTCGIISNITKDHLDFYADFKSYVNTKKHFLHLLNPGTPLVINVDDKFCQDIAANYSGMLITISLFTKDADISAEIISTSTYGSNIRVNINNQINLASGLIILPEQLELKLIIPGHHNIQNALLAIAAGLLAGLPLTTIGKALSEFKSVDRRMTVFHLEGRTIVDDTALNPGSINAVFETIRHMRFKRLIVANAVRGSRGTQINSDNAEVLAKWQQHLPFTLLVTSSTEAVDPLNIVTTEELRTFIQTLHFLNADYTYIASLHETIVHAYELTSPGDLLLLIGAQGMDKGRQILTALSRLECINPLLSSSCPFL
ncbi:Mur ligase family protein [Dendrosporobacter sp. 1207_IL3150]|uniref:Mur ligase family protein n=1 Tax=Dendrosporobacter sp. 1207_IL3150 TaxID=3084054 RepID=UPI002FD9F605